MRRCILVGCFASLFWSFATGEDFPTPPLLDAGVSIPQIQQSLPVLRFADGGDRFSSSTDLSALPTLEAANPDQTTSQRDELDELDALKKNLGKDNSDHSTTRDDWVGGRGVSSIRSIRFVAPRAAEQSAAYRAPRVSSMHSTVSWVSPRAVHRTLYFNDNPLERHGKYNNEKVQPVVSSVRFAADALKYPFLRISDLRNGDPLHSAKSPR